MTWSKPTLSRAWKELEEMRLVEPGVRNGRLRVVVPRREDGEAPYELPGGEDREGDWWNAYFTLPGEFWTGGVFAKLTLPGLAMLLIIAKETNGRKTEMYLPFDYANKWYGISPKTAQNGVRDLEKHGLLHIRKVPVKAGLSPTGTTTRVFYSLTGNFGHDARVAQRKVAKRERGKRLSKSVANPKPKNRSPKTLRARH